MIIEENDEIQEELDLIQSLQLLYEFGINLLPMQGTVYIFHYNFNKSIHSDIDKDVYFLYTCVIVMKFLIQSFSILT